jgi:hypothetical protein
MTKGFQHRITAVAGIGAILVAVTLSGCATLTTAINTMNSEISSGISSSSGSSSSTTQAMLSPQLSFYMMYGITSMFSAFGKGANYKPGQGTIWETTSASGGSTSTATVERALLKDNSDGTQWWRLEVTSSDSPLLYEYLVEKDGTIDKVRYKDPNTGKIEEFVPDKSKEQQQPEPAAQAQQSGSSSNSSGNGDEVTVKKDKQTISVKAGTFQTDHTTYIDKTKDYRQEIWTSEKVPGALVKYVNTDSSSGDTSTGQLAKIESGMTTVLGSY